MLPEFKYGSFEERVKSLEDHIYTALDMLEDKGSIDDLDLDLLELKGGHTVEKHITPKDTKAMIGRIISEGISGAGSFSDMQEALDCILNAVAYKSQEICKWQCRTQKEFKHAKDYHELAFTVYLGANTVAGVNLVKENDRIREKVCHGIRLIFNRNPETPCGFYLKTAYPDVHRHAEYTGREFTMDDIFQNQIYDFRSNVEKAAFVLKDTQDRIRVNYRILGEQTVKEVDYFTKEVRQRVTGAQESIRFLGNHNHKDYLIYASKSYHSQDDISYKIYEQPEKVQPGEYCRVKISEDELKVRYPALAAVLQTAREIVREGDPAIRRHLSLDDVLKDAEQRKNQSKTTDAGLKETKGRKHDVKNRE